VEQPNGMASDRVREIAETITITTSGWTTAVAPLRNHSTLANLRQKAEPNRTGARVHFGWIKTPTRSDGEYLVLIWWPLLTATKNGSWQRVSNASKMGGLRSLDEIGLLTKI